MSSRTQKKPPFVCAKLLKKALSTESKPGKSIKTYSRSSYIYPQLVGHDIAVHNGKQFIVVKITEDKVGHKLGEFSPTRKAPVHKVKVNAKLSNNK
jgi:small subunit ribosomal protein S19